MKTQKSLYGAIALLVMLAFGLISCNSFQPQSFTYEQELSVDDILLPSSFPVGGVDYPGQPAPGTLFWGAAIGGNGDPAYHENPTGETLSIRRTFWRWDQSTDVMINTAASDISNNRLPWISVKPPTVSSGRWAEVADGLHDTVLDEMLQELDALDGPVWLTVHHEPENDIGGTYGNIDDHLNMNEHVRDRMAALNTDNITLVLILMSWTWDERSGRNPGDWWEPGIYDLLGIDHYRDSEGSLLENGQPTAVWPRIRTWAEAEGVDVAVGEWGVRGDDYAAGQHVLEWYEEAANSHNDGEGARVVALCAFDSGLNAPSGSWELKGEQLNMFRNLMSDPRTANINNLPALVRHSISAADAGEDLTGYPVENAFDSDTTTRWSSWNVLSTAWIRFDLGQTESISEVRLKIYKADTRGPFPLAIKVGDNPASLQEAWSGDSSTDNDFQTFSFPSVDGRYVEVRMTDSNEGQFNENLLSLWEVEVYGE